MLSRKYRLPLRKNFFNIKKGCRKINSATIYLLFKENNTGKNSRFSVIISKKTSNKATIRNKIKRTIHEEIQKNLPFFKKNYNILIFTKPNIIKIEKKQIIEETKKLLNIILSNQSNLSS